MNTRFFRPIAVFAIMISFIAVSMAQTTGFDTSRMDTSADACEDFFQYANGTWVKNTQIPPSQSRWGSFNVLADNNRAILKTVLETAAAKRSPVGTDAQLIGDYYGACMDEAAINKAGISPLKPIFAKIDKMKTTRDLQKVIADLHNSGLGVLFRFGAGQDLKNSSQVIANMSQSGLSLPNTDYYTKTDATSKETREKFVAYMTNMFRLAGDNADTAAANAKTVMDFQMRLADASMAPVEMRNPENRYNKIAIADAAKLTPNFSWTDYIAARGLAPLTEINIPGAKFFTEMNAMIKDLPLSTWKTYLRWMVLNQMADTLSKPFEDERFDFYGRYLNGTKEQQPRWKRCAAAADQTLGEALGQEYVKVAFTTKAKTRMDELISNLFVAMNQRIDGLKWMSDKTKPEAHKKLNAIRRKIGYPDVLRGYKGLSIDRRSYFANDVNSAKFLTKRNLEDIGKPVDHTRWGMTPPTVNAYYSGTLNEIVFPAGILQPPFFNFEADDAINYGAIGAVIGHEISHGFDDQGSKFDADGNLKSWWTEDDRKQFEERASCVADQFSKYEVQPDLFINGRLTLGENIGDFSGLTISYAAFENSLAGHKRPANIDGFTPEQRFFLGWAQVWATKSTAAAERAQVLSDSHSAAKWRVNGPMSNMPEFAKAWGCKQGQGMVRKKFCEIW